jgi:transposase
MEQLNMSRRERERLVIFGQVKSGELCRTEAAELLSLSLRQVHRMYVRWRDAGDAALLHRSRGKVSKRRMDESQRTRALTLYRDRYRGFGPTLWAEKLSELHGIWVSHDTARRWLLGEGLLEKTRRGRRSRKRRPRKCCFGEMVQMDGSPHAWIQGPDGKPVVCCLMTVIDDATSRRRGRLFASETLEAAMTTLGLWCERFGVPVSVYVDRHGIYRADRDPTSDEIKAGKRPVTQFGRAMKELDVKLILARSPQAKGRVERSNGVLQDRLVKELKLANVTTIEQANAWLVTSHFFESLDEKFAVDAADATDAHRPLVVQLADVMCVKDKRHVGLDGCVQWQGRVLQLQDAAKLKKVDVWQHADGRLQLLGDGRRLAWKQIDVSTRKANQKQAKKDKRGPIRNNKKHKPSKQQQITITPQRIKPRPDSALRKTE